MIWAKGTQVTATSGRHSGESGFVEHSDKSITTVRFGAVIDPVWTKDLLDTEAKYAESVALLMKKRITV